MAFRWLRSTTRTLPVRIPNITAKASTTFTSGCAVVVDSTGVLDVAAAGAKVAGIYDGPTVTTGSADKLEFIEATPGDVFEVGYTGTPDSAFVVGQQTADIASGALLLNAADVTGGAFAILSIDTTNTKATVRAKLRQFS